MRIYLCDDEQKIRDEIIAVVAEVLPKADVKQFSGGSSLLEQMNQELCDILLLDIDMPKLSGMEVAARLTELPKKPLLVFVTNHDELVYESFRYHPFGFVRKQFLGKELGKVLKDCVAELEQGRKHFNFRAEGKKVCLLLSEIFFFESEGNYLKVYTESGEYRFRSTITAVENSLEKDGFIRVHKGFLVNQCAIRLFGTEAVELTNGSSLPVGKTYAEEARQQFMRYLRS